MLSDCRIGQKGLALTSAKRHSMVTTILHAGGSGDVADAVSLTGRTPKWLPPRGALQFHHLPGHTPGQVCHLRTEG